MGLSKLSDQLEEVERASHGFGSQERMSVSKVSPGGQESYPVFPELGSLVAVLLGLVLPEFPLLPLFSH